MGMILENGVGPANKLKIDLNGRAHTQTISESESLHAAELGDAYNINTGLVSLSGDTALLHVENNEQKDMVIEAYATGSFEGVTHSDDPYLILHRNPTGGTLIGTGTAVSINTNRNFGSSKTLTGNFYKGADGATTTGGSQAAILQASGGARGFYTINFILPQGSSATLEVILNASSGSANWYAAAIVYLKDPEGKD